MSPAVAHGVALETPRLLISTPRLPHAGAMRDFVARNQAHLAPWSPPAPEGVDRVDHWEGVAAGAQAAFEAGTQFRFWIRPREAEGIVIGSVGYSQVARGPFCNAILGYQIDASFEGRGLMREALLATNDYLFESQRLHRIAANYRPENTRSGRLLQGLGFRIEGFARDYLFIDGAWRDHILTSKVNPAFEAGWIRMA